VWGVTVGGTVLQNELRINLPAEFQAQFSQGASIAYKTILLVPGLEDPLKTEVQNAFAASLRVLWQVMAGFAGFGLLVSAAMKHLPLHTSIDERWGLSDREGVRST
jgi:hypothetical protein